MEYDGILSVGNGSFVKYLAISAALMAMPAKTNAFSAGRQGFAASEAQKKDSLGNAKKAWQEYGWRFPRSSMQPYEERYFQHDAAMHRRDFAYLFIIRKQYDVQYCSPVERDSLAGAAEMISKHLDLNSACIIMLLDNPDFSAIKELAKKLNVPIFVLPKTEGNGQKQKAFVSSGEEPDAFKMKKNK